MIDIYPKYCYKSSVKSFFNHVSSIIGQNLVPFFTGRSAMLAGLDVFGLTRMDEILVPPFLSHCVLSAISRTSFPTMTLSKRTKAILVYHQFGFPQQLDEIESVANKNHWIILNDCANTLFSKVGDKYLIDWGDFTVLSLSKLYGCGLGGALRTKTQELLPILMKRNDFDAKLAEEAFDYYLHIQRGNFGIKTQINIDKLYGYLPTIKSFASQAYSGLPESIEDIKNDFERRKKIYEISAEIFGNNVPQCEDEVIPFAIPITGKSETLSLLSDRIQRNIKVCTPVLHFDFARNMLDPDYRLAIVVGCHSGWTEDIIHEVFDLIKKGL